MTKYPCWLVMAVRSSPVRSFLTVTLAPAMKALL